MSTRTKEEELALDEKIARIQRKNEEILRRQKEIEEDKRMAEQQNAIVKLRSSSTNVSRERTPALKPSNRELRHELSEDFPSQEPPPMQRSTRGSFRGRGGERGRGQGDWKTSGGPPPDPRSFLYDDERDVPTPTQEGAEPRREERGWREERESFRREREFQRGRRGRGGMEYRGERGRRGRGGRRNEEEEWRAERMKIDEARIQRQRSADGKWRREWDCDKMLQEPLEEPKHEPRKVNAPSQEKWSPPSQSRGQFHPSPDRGTRQLSFPGAIAARGGRGRGRLDPAELEKPLDKFQIEALQSQMSPRLKMSAAMGEIENPSRHLSGGEVASPPSPHPGQDEFTLDPTRSVACVGNTVKISIPNVGAAQSTPKPQRHHETRGRYRSHTSHSSQSDDDSPRDHGHRGRRQRSHRPNRGQNQHQQLPKHSGDQPLATVGLETLPVQNKPPLPPFRAEQKPFEVKGQVEIKDGDDSWEDVTTSGTESMGEDFSSVHSTPLRRTIVNTMVISGKSEMSDSDAIESLEFSLDQPVLSGIRSETSASGAIESLEFSPIQPLEEKFSYEEYIKKLEMNEAAKSFQDGTFSEVYLQQQIDSEASSANISLNTSDNIYLQMENSKELEQENSHTENIISESNSNQVLQEEAIAKGMTNLNLVELEEESTHKEKDLEICKNAALENKVEDTNVDEIVEEIKCEADTINEQSKLENTIQIAPVTTSEESPVAVHNTEGTKSDGSDSLPPDTDVK